MLWESSCPASGAELVGWGAHAEDISSVMRHHHFLPLCSSLSGRCSSPTAQQLNGFCVGSGRSMTRLVSLRSSSTALEARSASPCPGTAVFPPVSVGRPLRVALQAAPVSSAQGCCAPAPEPLSRRGAGCNRCQHAVLTRPLGSGFSWSLQCFVICKSCRDH